MDFVFLRLNDFFLNIGMKLLINQGSHSGKINDEKVRVIHGNLSKSEKN